MCGICVQVGVRCGKCMHVCCHVGRGWEWDGHKLELIVLDTASLVDIP